MQVAATALFSLLADYTFPSTSYLHTPDNMSLPTLRCLLLPHNITDVIVWQDIAAVMDAGTDLCCFYHYSFRYLQNTVSYDGLYSCLLKLYLFIAYAKRGICFDLKVRDFFCVCCRLRPYAFTDCHEIRIQSTWYKCGATQV